MLMAPPQHTDAVECPGPPKAAGGRGGPRAGAGSSNSLYRLAPRQFLTIMSIIRPRAVVVRTDRLKNGIEETTATALRCGKPGKRRNEDKRRDRWQGVRAGG